MELQRITNICIIPDDLFHRIFATNQNDNILLNILPKNVSLTSINDISTDTSTNLSEKYKILSPCRTFHRKRQEKVNDY